MGLDIGIITTTVLPRPRGLAYDFAWEMAEEASVYGYMHGDDNSYGPFTKERVREMLEDFAERKRLSARQKAEVWAWVESLPWEGDMIELHFNW